MNWKPMHVLTGVSVSVGAVMIPAGPENGIGIISSDYLKDPTDPRWDSDAGMKEWRAFMAKYYPDGRCEGRRKCFRLWPDTHDAARPEAVRRRFLSGEHDEAGDQPAGSREPGAAAGRSRSAPARRTIIRSANCNSCAGPVRAGSGLAISSLARTPNRCPGPGRSARRLGPLHLPAKHVSAFRRLNKNAFS